MILRAKINQYWFLHQIFGIEGKGGNVHLTLFFTFLPKDNFVRIVNYKYDIN